MHQLPMKNPEASVQIEAPLALVWEVMLDTTSYAAWNPFVVRADCPSQPSVGDPIKLHVRWADGSGATSPERITVVDGPETGDDGVTRATLAYVYEGWPARLRLIRGTRLQRLQQAPGGPTTYSTIEEFAGPMARFAGPGRVADGFRRHAAALKARAESLP